MVNDLFLCNKLYLMHYLKPFVQNVMLCSHWIFKIMMFYLFETENAFFLWNEMESFIFIQMFMFKMNPNPIGCIKLVAYNQMDASSL